MNFFPWTHLCSSEVNPGTVFVEYTVHSHWAAWFFC